MAFKIPLKMSFYPYTIPRPNGIQWCRNNSVNNHCMQTKCMVCRRKTALMRFFHDIVYVIEGDIDFGTVEFSWYLS